MSDGIHRPILWDLGGGGDEVIIGPNFLDGLMGALGGSEFGYECFHSGTGGKDACRRCALLLIKGQGVAQCYYRPLWRAVGEVDWWVKEKDVERRNEY